MQKRLNARPLRNLWQNKWLKLDNHHELIQSAADAAEKFAKEYMSKIKSGSMLVLIGDTGCGKTHIARSLFAWARHVRMAVFENCKMDSSPEESFHLWPEICDGFKRGEYGIERDMIEDDLVVIDDIGAEHDPSKSAASELCKILSRREKKFTIITTNIQPGMWPARWDDRIADRLMRGNSKHADLTTVEPYSVAKISF